MFIFLPSGWKFKVVFISLNPSGESRVLLHIVTEACRWRTMDTMLAAVTQQCIGELIISVCVCVFVNQGLVSGSEAHLWGAAAEHTDINWLFVMVMCSSNVKARHSEVNSEIDQRTAKENSQDGQYIRHMFVLHAFHWPQRQNAVEVNTLQIIHTLYRYADTCRTLCGSEHVRWLLL